MTYFLIALDAEARPLIDHYKLKRSSVLPYAVYTGEDIILLVTGQGRENAMMGTSALCGYRRPDPYDILVNLGICGAPAEFLLGELFIIHQIQDAHRNYYPDILYPHPLKETSLLCVNQAIDSLQNYPVDMESAGVFIAASRFFKLHQMVFAKVVSDHFEPSSVTKEDCMELIKLNTSKIDTLLYAIQSVQHTNNLLSSEEKTQLETLQSYFTLSQANQLEEAMYYAKLKNPEKPIVFPSYQLPNSKRERSQLHEHLILLLTH